MTRSSDLTSLVKTGLATPLTVRKGRVVPEAAEIGPNEGVELDAAYVYADMADSSKLAHTVYRHVAARIIRSYVNTATNILNYWDGEIRSFDGDRVMAIFIGENRNRAAVRAAFEINWAASEVIWPLIQAQWNDVASWGWSLRHGVGVDTGEALLIRTGVRGDNDIASVGSAPNVAAKLSELRSPGSIFITKAVFDDLNDNLWFGPEPERKSLWSKLYGVQNVGGVPYTVYSSSWYWGP